MIHKSIFILVILFISLSFAQTTDDLQGKWKFTDVEFSGPNSAYLNENPTPCMEKAVLEFSKEKMTTRHFAGENCEALEPDVFSFVLKGTTLEFYYNLEEKWKIAEITKFTANNFIIIYKLGGNLQMKVSLQRI